MSINVEAQAQYQKVYRKNYFWASELFNIMWFHTSYKTWIYLLDFKMVRFFAQIIFQNGSFDEMLATSGLYWR